MDFKIRKELYVIKQIKLVCYRYITLSLSKKYYKLVIFQTLRKSNANVKHSLKTFFPKGI